jgi:hypothetical protein
MRKSSMILVAALVATSSAASAASWKERTTVGQRYAIYANAGGRCVVDGKYRNCADPALKRAHINWIPGCNGPQTAGKAVHFGGNTFTCSGRQ